MPSVETVTILITDLVGSTGLESRLGPVVADGLRRDHFALLREAIRETGGTEVKNMGDGLMVAFRSSSAAVDCAIAMQQRLARRNRSTPEQLRIRIGLGTGDATVEEDDYFGMPTIEAARLCDKASADGILVTELVSLMARRLGDVFAPVGQLNLKGIPDPVTAFEVRWDRLDSRGGLPLPPALGTQFQFGFVGRRQEQAALRRAWEATAAGTGGVTFVSGPPGSGKTRLITEAALAAHKEGATVLYGRCQEEPGTPYQPLLQALRHYVAVCPPARLAGLREHSGVLIRLAPELASTLPEPVSRTASERRSEQRLVSDAVHAVLAGASRHAPTVLALDDLHWARPPLLGVCRRLADTAESEPLLVIAAYRDTEVGTEDPLSDLLVDLRRKSGAARITLPGLTGDDVAELIRASGTDGSALDAELARELQRFTGGSPLLVAELLAGLGPSDGGLQRVLGWAHPWDAGTSGLPDGVQENIRARANRLSDAAKQVLEAAAVVGQHFEARLVADVAGQSESDSLTALDEALAAGLLVETESMRSFAFANAAVRHGIYSDLANPRRLALHRAVAEYLEAHEADRPSEVAEQWFAATALAGTGAAHLSKAIDSAEHAGRCAAEQAQHSLAGRQYRHAAQLVEASDADSRRQCELLLAAGRSFAQADQLPAAKEAFQRAADMARRAGDPRLLACAALGYGMGPGDAFYVSGVDEVLVGLLEQALAGLAATGGSLRVRVLSRLAVELHVTGFAERREALSREAVELAASLADPAAELIALYGWLTANWSPDELPGRLAGSDDVIRRAGDLGDTEMVYNGHDMKLRALLELGEMAMADQEIAALDEAARLIGTPLYAWHVRSCRAMRALHAGDTEVAGRWMREALDVASGPHRHLALRSLDAQAALRHWLVGPPRDLVPILRRGVESCPWLPVRRARLAFGLAELGRKTEASAEFERLAQDDFAALPRDGNWLLAMGFLALACAALGDAERAAALSRSLEPYAERFLVSGDATSTWGPMSTVLATLAVTTGRYDDAADRFERALEQCAAAGAHAQTVFAQREYARMLLLRGRSGDSDRAARLLGDAAASAANRGFGGLAVQIAALQAKI